MALRMLVRAALVVSRMLVNIVGCNVPGLPTVNAKHQVYMWATPLATVMVLGSSTLSKDGQQEKIKLANGGRWIWAMCRK